MLRKFSSKSTGVGDEKIQRTFASRQFRCGILPAGDEKHVEDLLRMIERRDRSTAAIVGLRLGSPGTTDASVGGHHQRGMACVLPHLFGIDLINGDRILIRPVAANGRSGEILVGIGVAVHLSGRRMRKPRINGDLLTQRLEDIEHFGKLEISLAASRKPTPIPPGRIILQRQADPVWMVDTEKASGRRVLSGTTRGKGFKPRQGQRHSRAMQKLSSV